jgi:hypothetical protein
MQAAGLGAKRDRAKRDRAKGPWEKVEVSICITFQSDYEGSYI